MIFTPKSENASKQNVGLFLGIECHDLKRAESQLNLGCTNPLPFSFLSSHNKALSF